MKKIVALFVAVVLVCSLSVSALAADAGSSRGITGTTVGDLIDGFYDSVANPEPSILDTFLNDFLGELGGDSLGKTVADLVKEKFLGGTTPTTTTMKLSPLALKRR